MVYLRNMIFFTGSLLSARSSSMQGGSPTGNDDDRKASSLIDARRQRMDDERLCEPLLHVLAHADQFTVAYREDIGDWVSREC